MTRLLIAVVVVAASLGTSIATADTVYIRDTLYVPLRGGQSTEHRILHRGLRSGTALERLETNDDTGYTRVRTSSGMEGWLQTQYLVEEPIAKTQLDDVIAQMEDIEARYQQTLLRLSEATDENTSLDSEAQSLRDSHTALQQELSELKALAADTINIDVENARLTEERTTLQDEIDYLQQQNESLSGDRTQRWFLAGGSTVLIGLLFGFWLARRLYNRRNTGGWA